MLPLLPVECSGMSSPGHVDSRYPVRTLIPESSPFSHCESFWDTFVTSYKIWKERKAKTFLSPLVLLDIALALHFLKQIVTTSYSSLSPWILIDGRAITLLWVMLWSVCFFSQDRIVFGWDKCVISIVRSRYSWTVSLVLVEVSCAVGQTLIICDHLIFILFWTVGVDRYMHNYEEVWDVKRGKSSAVTSGNQRDIRIIVI